jgi:hypothetical protein
MITILSDLKNLFTEHPRSIGESYLQHMRFALLMSLKLFFLSIAIVIHAVLPFIFTKTASTMILNLAERFSPRLDKLD